MRSHAFALVALVVCASTLLACGKDDQDPEQAEAVWSAIHAGAGFHAWQRAPGYAVRRPSFTAHASAVEIFVSPEITAAIEQRKPIDSWPVGSVIVKEGFSSITSDHRKLVAVMKKNPDGWFWAEYDDDGTAMYSGKPSVCVDCHDNRRDYSDWVYAFRLPR